jgi:hypothetical protein
MAVSITLSAAVSSAEIVATSVHADIVSLDLTAAGTQDWAVFGVNRSSGSDGSLSAVDFKTGGDAVQVPKPQPRVGDLSRSRTPDGYADEILRNVDYYKRSGDDACLKAADACARLAYVAFCDDACPLPKACAGSRPTMTQGKPFPDFYFGGAKLMHAFALLGEAN